MMSEEKIELLYQQVGKTTSDLLNCNYEPLAVAGVMLAQAMSIYKTLLSDKDYNQMIEFITENKDRVKTFEVPRIQ